MSPQTAILLAVALPLGAAPLIVLAGRRPNLREAITLTTAIALFPIVASLLPAVAAGARPDLAVIEMLPGYPLAFRVEPLGMLFALVASFLWIVTSLYSIGYMRGHGEENQTRFYAYFAISISATMGVAFAGNLLTLFAFYEALTLATYPLVAHHGTEEAKRAGRVYLGVLIGTSIGFFLFAIVWTALVAETLDFVAGGILAGRVSDGALAVLLALYVFGVGKAAVMPFHRWLPAAMVAPTPVSALLHAVAVVKAGVFTILKVAIYIFGIDTLADAGAGRGLAYVAAATIVIASLVAMTKDNLKARLAYSTVSQLSYIVLGALLASGLGAIGGAMHIAMHAFGKITLFFCAGAIMVASHKTEVSEMRGLGRTMPFTFGAFLIGALSVSGLPPFGGMWSKLYLALAAAEGERLVLLAVLMLSSVLNIAYLVSVAAQAFFCAPIPDPRARHSAFDDNGAKRWHEAPGFCLAAIAVTAAGCLALFFAADRIFDFLQPIADGR